MNKDKIIHDENSGTEGVGEDGDVVCEGEEVVAEGFEFVPNGSIGEVFKLE
jgi:hypothetical protein